MPCPSPQVTGLGRLLEPDRLRWVLNQAAQTAKRSPEFAATYAGITKRRGKKIATIAIARKLLTRAYHLLTDAQASAALPARAACAPTDPEGAARPWARSPQRHPPATRPRSIT